MRFLWESLKALSPESEFNGGLTYDSIICVKGVKPSLEDVEIKNAELEAAEPMRLLRIERNRRLAEADWVTLKAYSQGVEVHPIWKNYMQALRDLPYVCIHMTDDVPKLDEQGNLINVPWPDVPQPHHMKDY